MSGQLSVTEGRLAAVRNTCSPRPASLDAEVDQSGVKVKMKGGDMVMSSIIRSAASDFVNK